MNTQFSTAHYITKALQDARTRTLSLIEGLSNEQLIGPVLATINPLRWEIAHAAYFHETWVLRHLGKQDPIMPEADDLFDSINIQHEERWNLNLPSMGKTLSYMDQVLQNEIKLLESIDLTNEEKYFYLLSIFHEDMHDEAFMYTYQTLSYPTPSFINSTDSTNIARQMPEDIEIPGGKFNLGAPRDSEFVFDNEKWSHKITVPPYKISKYAVCNEEYLEFVEDKGYLQEKYWTEQGWYWREEKQIEHPIYWQRKENGNWLMRKFDQWDELNTDDAVIHINWYEAQAYCKWSNRRLPTEAEWEFAAATEVEACNNMYSVKRIYPWGSEYKDGNAHLDGKHDGVTSVYNYPEGESAWGCRQMIGNVWEWTDSTFIPYPGFSPDWYTEYSRPLFGQTKVLRGGAWTTRSRMIRNTWRNYYGADRNDVFAGFRTCAL